MKYKRIQVPRYLFKDELGDFLIENVTILVPADSDIDGASFNQERDVYMISVSEVERMMQEVEDL